ncbi:uncharacterized protein LOC132866831 [Neoarius graeffei]|uniref:uncharacterized protein LOC132866831 n=1 Tax=Neoarius graeffei TaxID=443677 RepID=UPI00298C9FC4|nr:uncharacterized protein LOC132866831 [Neoarius graeffei]
MKTLLIITFYLMSGPVHCNDVIGYPGGRVIINFKKPVIPRSTGYFCKMKTVCEELITAQASVSTVHKDRFTLFKTDGLISLIFRSLSLQDTGLYQYGETGVWSENIDLKVKSDPCCSETKSVTGYLGESVMISCSYPTEFETNIKSFFKLDDYAGTEVIFTRAKEAYQNGRVSISDDGRSSVFSVIISDVREDDGGVYSCAVRIKGTAVRYHSLFTEIQLQVTDSASVGPPPYQTTEPPFGEGGSSIIIIPGVVCVILLLSVGLGLIFYKQRCNKSQGSLHRNLMEKHSDIHHYEETKDHRCHSGTEETAHYCTIPLSTIPSDPPNTVYATAQLPTIPTNPPNTVYATAQLPTIPTNPPNTVDATAQLPTIPTNLPNTVYATAELPTIPTNPPNTVYATAELPTIPTNPPNTV